MQGLIDTGLGYISRSTEEGTDDPHASELVQWAKELGNHAYRFLKELDGAGADEIPHQVVSPFQRWVNGLGVTNSIFFRADHVANYELATFSYEKSLLALNFPSESLKLAISKIDWPFRRISVPSQAMGILPHFAIVGHELGHAIQDRKKLDLKSYEGVFDDSLNSTTQLLASSGLAVDEQLLVKRQDSLHSWVNEIWSDAIGLYLTGPAVLFAFGALFDLTGGGLGLGLSHPPHELRLRMFFRHLNDGTPSHCDVFKAVTGLSLSSKINSPFVIDTPPSDELFDLLKNQIGARDASICTGLVPIIEAIADEIYAEAKRVLEESNPEMIYAAEQLKIDLEQHLEPLCMLIPPIEYRKDDGVEAVSLAGVLNIGWAALMTKLDDFSDPSGAGQGKDGAAMKMERLQQLLLKAVELSEARIAWENAK